MTASKEYEFTIDDFDYFRTIVTRVSGIVATDDKYTMYCSRLTRRLRSLGLSNFSAYRDYLDKNRETEGIELVNAVTTNLTAFFREKHHFDYIRETLIPNKIKRRDHRLRIWSAGCSTGEEAYTIAISLLRDMVNPQSWDIKILATDIDSHVLHTASEGVYDESRVADIEPSLLQKFFNKGDGDLQGSVIVNPEVRQLIQFKQLNLLDNWPISEQMDFIFCRNVVIYFDKQTKAKIVARFADQLQENGTLFMGHSESLYKSTDRFKLLGKTIYQLASLDIDGS